MDIVRLELGFWQKGGDDPGDQEGVGLPSVPEEVPLPAVDAEEDAGVAPEVPPPLPPPKRLTRDLKHLAENMSSSSSEHSRCEVKQEN